MFRSRPSFFRSVLGALVALVLLGTFGLAPAGALSVREQATLGPPQAVLLPASPVGPGPTTAPFADVAADHDFYEEISWLAQTGVSTGWSGPENARLFRPYEPVLRDQMAAFLYRMAGSPRFTASSVSPFADVNGGHDFYRQISWLAKTGVSTGWSGHTDTRLFRPYQPVLRDQMAAFLYRMAGSPAFDAPAISPFADVPTDHDFYQEISWLAEVRVSTGWSGPDGTRLFRPYQPVLRDQMAAFLHRLDPLLPGRDTPIAQLVTGREVAYALRTDGAVWAWGGNYAGQLGNGTTMNSSVPVQVAGLSGAESLVTDGSSTFAITAGGTVWAWGRNHLGQLGNGTATGSAAPARVTVPVRVTIPSGARSIEPSGLSTYALAEDGTVWAWGSNRFGELGNGTTTNSSVPVQVTGLSGVQSLEASGSSVYALTEDGTVWAWGYNSSGELGDGTTEHSSVPVQVSGLPQVESLEAGGSSAYALTAEGAVWTWGGITTDPSAPAQVTGLPDVESLESGTGYALTTEGAVWNLGGVTTDPSVPVQVTGLPEVHSFAVNSGPPYAVTADGTAWAWGGNFFGQLGNGTTTDSSAPVRVVGLSDVRDLDADGFSAHALTADGTVWAWGRNQFGQLGDGTTTNSSVPVRVSRING